MPGDERNEPAEGEHAPALEMGSAAPLAADDSTRLLSSLYASFTSTYLTLTSIIQGVVLAYLVVVIDDESGSFATAHWILVVTIFLMIVSAWHEYMTAVTVFVWIPRLRDSLIPFLLGGSELVVIRALGWETELERFFLAMAITSLVTLAAFVNMYVSAAGEQRRNRVLLANVRPYERLNLAFAGCSAALFLVFSAIEAQAAASTTLDIVLAAATLALVVAFLVRSSLYWAQMIEVLRSSGVARSTR